jgi:diguanylate cyclase (GGDEF)-like protein
MDRILHSSSEGEKPPLSEADSPWENDALLSARLDALAATSLITSVANIPVAGLVVAVFWNGAPRLWLAAWIATLVALMSVRWLLVRAYRRGRPKAWTARNWAVAAVVQSGLLGTAWGVASLWLAWYGDTFQNTMLACASLCIVMGALANVAYWPVHFSFQFPLLMLEAFGFATAGRPEGLYFAGGLVVASLALLLLAPRLGSHMTRGFKLAEEKRALVEKLQQANELLQRLAVTDALTGLSNRRGLDGVLQYEWTRALRTKRSVSLLMIDVDEFKAFNDRYGHLAGDTCLQQIAGVIDNGMRKNIDLAVRYGGEEFALLLPETEISEGFLAAERLRRAIAAIGQAHPASNHGVVTVSIGVAAMVPVRDKTGDELVARADAGARP